MKLHYTTPVYHGSEPAPHYKTDPWVQPTTHGLIDTRDVYASSEPVTVDAPKGSTIEDSPQGLVVTRPRRGDLVR